MLFFNNSETTEYYTDAHTLSLHDALPILRQDLGEGPDRSYATVGFEGLAPYWFETEGALFLPNKGDLLGRLEGYYDQRSEEHTSELQSLMRISYAVFCLIKKNPKSKHNEEFQRLNEQETNH